MKRKKLAMTLLVLLAALVPLALFAAKNAIYVTSDEECDDPINLEDNAISPSEEINVWLTLPAGVSVNDLCWVLYDKGKPILEGDLDEICDYPAKGLTLADTDINVGQLIPGSYSLRVVNCETGDTFSRDSFRVVQ